jgi:hypothetical protein
MMDNDFDAFICYRRVDGTGPARKLRRKLLDYRPPNVVTKSKERAKLSIYLDRSYERATEDFFERTIKPALERSRYLIVVVTPGVYGLGPGGEENWVTREIRHFLKLPQRRNIVVAVARGELVGPLPAGLDQAFPNVQRLDIQGYTWRGLIRWPLLWRADEELLALISALYEVGSKDMPLLRQEDARLRTKRAWAWSAGAVIASVAFLVLTAWALWSRSEAIERERIATSNALALKADRLARYAPDRALAVAVSAFETAYTTIAEQVLWKALDSAPLIQVIPLNAGSAESVALFADGDVLYAADVSADKRNTVIHRTGQNSIQTNVPGKDAAAVPGGRLVATSDGTDVVFWDVQSGMEKKRLPKATRIAKGNAFSSDGMRAITIDLAGLAVWDVAAIRKLRGINLPEVSAARISLSPDGRYVLTTSFDGLATVWSVDGDTGKREVKFESQPIYVAEFSASGTSFVLANAEGWVAIHSVAEIKQKWKRRVHSSPQELPVGRTLDGLASAAEHAFPLVL